MLTIDESLEKKVNSLAAQLKIEPSSVLRRAVEAFLRQNKQSDKTPNEKTLKAIQEQDIPAESVKEIFNQIGS